MSPPPVPCPRCDFPVEYEQNECPRCAEERRARWMGRLQTLGIVLAVLGVLALWQRHRIATGWRQFMLEVAEAQQPALRKKRLQAEAAAAANAPQEAAPDPGITVSSFVFVSAPTPVSLPPPVPRPAPASPPPDVRVPAAPKPAPVQDQADAVAPEAPGPPTEHRRRFYGVVYDASTLKPVAGARLVFKVSGAENGWPATTNEFGHYQLDLVKSTVEQPMVVSVAPIAGYRSGQLEDTDPPLRDKPRSARRRIIDETTDNDLDPVPLRFRTDSDLVPLDLVLLPARHKVMP